MYHMHLKCAFSADAYFYKPKADATKVNKSMISADGVFFKDVLLDCFGRKINLFGRKIDGNRCQMGTFGRVLVCFAQIC